MNLSVFANKVIVITGASDGIGAELARQLAVAKPKLVLAARRRDALEAVARDCEANGAQTLVVPTDVSVETDCRALIAKAQNGEPLPSPTRNADGLYSSYTQDTIVRLPARGNDDHERRRLVARTVGQFVVQTDKLGREARKAELARLIATEFGNG